MQLDGVGSDHGSHAHQLTHCMHEHTHYHKMDKSAAASGAVSQAARLEMAQQQQEAQFSLAAWLERTVRGGRSFLKGIWGSNDTPAAGQAGDRSGQAQAMAQLANGNTAGTVTAETSGKQAQVNPYFQAVEDRQPQHVPLVQKMRVRVRKLAGSLAGQLLGKFSAFQAKSSLQTKQQRPKEDLRRRSKYKRDELEIDCVLTDESYLLDSYNRKGEYSKL